MHTHEPWSHTAIPALTALLATITLLCCLCEHPLTPPEGDVSHRDIPVPLGVSLHPPITIGTHTYTATAPLTITGVLTNVILLSEQQ